MCPGSDDWHTRHESRSNQFCYLAWRFRVSAVPGMREGRAYKRKEILRFGVGGGGDEVVI